MKSTLIALSLILGISNAHSIETKTFFCKKIKSISSGGTYVSFRCYLDNGQVSDMFQSGLENDYNGPITYSNDVIGLVQRTQHRASEETRAGNLLETVLSFNNSKQTNPNSTQKLRVVTRKSNVYPDKEIINMLSIEE